MPRDVLETEKYIYEISTHITMNTPVILTHINTYVVHDLYIYVLQVQIVFSNLFYNVIKNIFSLLNLFLMTPITLVIKPSSTNIRENMFFIFLKFQTNTSSTFLDTQQNV